MLLAVLPGAADRRRLPARAGRSAWLLHALLLALDIGGLGSATAAAHGSVSAPVLSVTVWLVLAVYCGRKPAGAAAGGAPCAGRCWALRRCCWPGPSRASRHAVGGSPWAPLHWLLGVGSYGLFGAAVLHALLLDAAEARLRCAQPRLRAGAVGMPLLQLERLTFRFVEAGFVVLSAALVLGVATTAQWRWDHKTVFSLLGWAVVRGAACRARLARLARPARDALAVRRRGAAAAGLCRLALRARSGAGPRCRRIVKVAT